MTVDERTAAARRRRKDPPLCHCGVRATLVVPPCGGSPSSRPKYSPFFWCSIKMMDGWPVCQFNEYVQGPRSVWPSDEEVRAYEAGQAQCRVRSILKRDASVVFWPSVVWFPQSLVMDGIAAMETLFGRAGHVIGNGSVVVMSLLLGSDVWVNETKKQKLEN
ncbi:hypothetical protein HU200_049985 [Digitaria exilis]|uniref:Uncharacterized protein n=1 Tax=Digitaria exilis TaxID=1010633 RepID=A0A835APD3_9POAL|nr:hypothetical protein HU200_049985 [Digitaria exilis]